MKFLLLLWQLLWKSLASLVIFLAVLAGAGKLMLPQIGQYRGWVEQWLGERMRQTVRIGELEGEWRGLGPELHLKDFRILDGDDEALLNIHQIDVVFSPQSLFTSKSRFLQFVLRKTTLEMRRDQTGQFRLSITGLAPPAGPPRVEGSQADLLTRLGSLRLADSQLVLHWSDEAFPLVFEHVNALYTSSSKKIWAAAWLVPLGENAPVEIRLRHLKKSGKTDLYLQTTQMNLLPWAPPLLAEWTRLRSGRLNLQVWASLEQGRLQEAWARFSLHDLGLESPEPVRLSNQTRISPRYWRSRLGASLHYQRQESSHELQVLDFYSQGGDEIEDHGRARLRWNSSDAWLALQGLQLGRADQLLRATALAEKMEAWLPYETSPAGELVSAKARIGLDDFRIQAADIRLRALSLNPLDKRPGFRGLNARIQRENGQWHFQLNGPDLSLDYPHLFRDSLQWSSFIAEGRFQQDTEGWMLDVEPLTALNPDVQIQARLHLRGQAGKKRPFVDMQADIRRFQAAAAWKYWPRTTFKPKLLKWLDQALIDGQADGTFVLHGDLNTFPFRRQQGRFAFQAQVEDLQLQYHPQWPVGHVRRAILEFDRSAMRILELEGEVAGLEVSQAKGGIANYRTALLDLSLTGRGTARQARQLLAQSPVHALYARQDEQFELDGQVRTRVRLRIPMSPRAEQNRTTVEGRVKLSEGALNLPEWELAFHQLEGELRFSETGFHSNHLRGETLNRFVDIELCVAGHCPEAQQALHATLRGQFPMESMIRQARVADRLIPFMPGESQWRVEVNIPRDGLAHLQAQSNLVGVTSLLPAPLDKGPEQALDLKLALDLPPAQGRLNLRFGPRMQLQVNRPGLKNQSLIQLGETQPELAVQDLPEQSMVLAGETENLDLSGWLAIRKDLFGPATRQEPPWLRQADIQARRVQLLQHDMGAMQLRLRQEDGFWKARLNGERMQGEVQASIFPGPDDTLIADFQRIHWPRPDTEQLEQLGQQARQHNIRVSEIPRLHLLAEDFRLGQIDLGEVRLEAYPIADGLRIERVQARSDALSLTASGDWLEDGDRTRSQFQIHLGVQSLGKLLARLGYANLIQGGQTIANFDVNWPGPPTAFALERLGGELEIQVGPGQILEVQPGAGRIFGLLSLQQLPRRLLLDFRDVFNRGLSFDKINGHFRLEQGVAYTEDLKMESKTAQILLTGQTDLARQTYDQTIVVIPHVGQALPMVGAITGGVAGAAAMLAIQGLIGKSLDESNGVVYRLTGPWSDPVIERLSLKKRKKAQKSGKDAPAPTTGTPANTPPDKG